MGSKSKANAASIETIGIEHVPDGKRHGTSVRAFTVWFAANLGAAGFAIGVLAVYVFGLTLAQAIPVLLASNLVGGFVLGLTASMGPELGVPQMLSSRSAFGRKGNYLPAAFNWISTIGWFTFNTILGVLAMQAIYPALNLDLGIIALMLIQVVIAIFGHDIIHVFEKVMSIVLGLVFLALAILIVASPNLGVAFSYVPVGGNALAASFGAIGATIAVAFSYIIAWSPYASDYSRYFPKRISKRSVALAAMAGGALASFGVELLGAVVAAVIQNPAAGTQNTILFAGIASTFGWMGVVMLVALAVGVITANALNIYSNSLSALVMDIKAKRWITVAVGGFIGFALALAVGANFVTDFENFLLILDYWITPWVAIMLVDFFLARRTASYLGRKGNIIDIPTVGIYVFAVILSAPFMVPSGICTATASTNCVAIPLASPIISSMAGIFGYADFSYFISFIIAAVAYYAYRKL
jgi:NCS1 family nucleobase:cation symporter-1